MSSQSHRTLSQVVTYVKGLIETNLAQKYFWLKAEISNINFHSKGNCYLDLVETKDGKTIAQVSANIWSGDIIRINSQLGDNMKEILRKGAEIMCLSEVTYHEVYGLKIKILEVDKYFALGELERRKRETISRVTEEGLIGINKLKLLPGVVQNIAVVGSPNTSGHTDFIKQLEKNEYGYAFNIMNYSCQVQGDKAEHEIIECLDRLDGSSFDVIVLVRGGGSKLDLEVFNSYAIARRIATLKRPVLTGIGHETDTSVADLVANSSFKTPSAVGAFIVNRNNNFDNAIKASYRDIMALYEIFMQRQNHRLKQCLTNFQASSIGYTQLRRGRLHHTANRIVATIRESIAKQAQFLNIGRQQLSISSLNILSNKQSRLQEIATLLQLHASQKIQSQNRKLEHNEELIRLTVSRRLKLERDSLVNTFNLISLYHPDKTLERGYSITRINGRELRHAPQVKIGDSIDIELLAVHLKATITSKNLKNSKWKTLLTKMLPKN